MGRKGTLPHFVYLATDQNIYSIDSDGAFPVIFNYSKYKRPTLESLSENGIAEAVESYLYGRLTDYEDIPIAMRRELEKHW